MTKFNAQESINISKEIESGLNFLLSEIVLKYHLKIKEDIADDICNELEYTDIQNKMFNLLESDLI